MSPRLRPFGSQARDLSIDFAGSPPQQITDLLTACLLDAEGQRFDESQIWGMAVSSRVAWLLALAAIEDPNPFTVTFACQGRDCGQPIEVELSLGEVLEAATETPDEPFAVHIGSDRYMLRRPTGADQVAWLQTAYGSEVLAQRAIASSLIVEGPSGEPGPEVVAAIDAYLDVADPLVRFTLTAVCPYCGDAAEHDAGLAEAALRILSLAQTRTIADVHGLARAYGWTENEVLGLPAWRRQAYLDLVVREAVR
ncbi:hypothetical protein [Mycolicibacterium iranicum]|uniref:Uncharacterized protein n=1 Tax=Mycolicibacterium iranicum TaxID=912594 RepID=A0A178LT40_MYCIR|nr:hypothetical protein [Mycolicibacterium iranicum]OAN36775.1 hypothetical protein A4X20_06155 [Mycolicibacterium iranicum]